MAWRRRFFDWAYGRGAPGWDTGITAPEVVEVVEGPIRSHPGALSTSVAGPGRTSSTSRSTASRRWGWTSRRSPSRPRERSWTASPARRSWRATSRGSRRSAWRGRSTSSSTSAASTASRGRVATRTPAAWPPWHARAPCSCCGPSGRGSRGRLVGMGVMRREIEERFGPDFELVRVVPGRRPRGAAWYTLRRRQMGAARAVGRPA